MVNNRDRTAAWTPLGDFRLQAPWDIALPVPPPDETFRRMRWQQRV